MAEAATPGTDIILLPKPGAISDRRFITQLEHLRQLKQFLFEEKIPFKAEDLDHIDLEELNNLFHSSSGRLPSDIEWRTLDEKFSILASYLGDELRHKIRIRELGMFFRVLPICFLAASVISTVSYINLPYMFEQGSGWRLLCWLVVIMTWLISQGGLGACAFLGTSVIVKGWQGKDPANSGDNREYIDLTDPNCLTIRIMLGILFAVLFGFPFALGPLNSLSNIYWAGSTPSQSELSMLFIPFVAGFSTNLVLAILRKFVGAAEAMFGSPGRT